MSQTAISNATVVVNNIAAGVVPNSVSFTEGFGEYNYRAQSGGGGSVQGVFSENIEDRLPMIKFSLYPTPENIAMLRQWKANRSSNAVTLSGQIPDNPNFTRSFRSAAVLNNYEVNLGADTQIDVEMKAETVT
jgi:hypothetical protein